MQLLHKPSLQPESACLSKPLPRPTLVARWEVEDNKLICRWIVDDRVKFICSLLNYGRL